MRLSLLLAITSFVSIACAQTACNGDPSLCSKTYNEIAYITTHNAFGSIANNPASNQHYDIVTQLTDGVRGLMLHAYATTTGNTTIELCHTYCGLLDAGPLTATLVKIKTWLEANPNEVVTIFLGNYVPFTPAQFAAAYAASGINTLVWTQPVGKPWPTLQTMINANQRLVNFIDVGANYTVAPWLMAEYDFVFETPYDNQTPASFVCTIDRPTNPADPASMMYVMNHFLYGVDTIGSLVVEIPQPGTANTTNSEASLGAEATLCNSTFNRIPNFLAVDFYDEGQVFQVAAQLNGVPYVAKQLGTNQASSTTGQPTSSGFSISVSFGAAAKEKEIGWGLTAVMGILVLWVFMM
ncbi:PLC-like phosphodiesterase [Endogone sp. FLAS-F59071]|nr:PLC-like phosphodiesterase [Endogone sp. FLAS-F59071]|eukprot:RUS13793.1 PLC-like phosphodiesterase [Endogone sp. FLAS-F59071]